MTFAERIAFYRRLDTLIRIKAGGSPVQLCKRLNVSRATLTRAIDFLRNEYNAPIVFCTTRERYRYERGFFLKF
jgi:hypothetical protein